MTPAKPRAADRHTITSTFTIQEQSRFDPAYWQSVRTEPTAERALVMAEDLSETGPHRVIQTEVRVLRTYSRKQ
jgi:hypothetical protein